MLGGEIIENIITDNLNLVHHVINKYYKCNKNDYDDYYQVGVIGLINASKNYNPSLDASFSTYAYACIKNEILKYIKKNETNYISLEETVYDDIRVEDTIEDERIKPNISGIINDESKDEMSSQLQYFLGSDEIVIRMLYVIGCKNYKQKEIEKILNILQYKISRIKNKALKEMKNFIYLKNYRR